MSRVTSDVDTISTFMQWGGLLILVSASAQLVLATVLMLVWSWQLTLLVYACFVPLVFVVRAFQQRLAARVRGRPGAGRRDARRGRRVGRRRAGRSGPTASQGRTAERIDAAVDAHAGGPDRARRRSRRHVLGR